MSLTQRSSHLTQRAPVRDLAHGDDLDDVRPWGHPPHAHPFGQLVYAVSGTARITVHTCDGTADSVHAVDTRSAVWIPPGVWHSAQFDVDFYPSPHDLDLEPAEHPGAACGARDLVVDAEMRAELLTAHLRSDPSLPRTREGLAVQRGGAPSRPPWPTGGLALAVAEAVDADPADPRELDDWAAELHTSPASIRRSFTSTTGLTWSAWRSQHRLHAAVRMLHDGGRPSAVARAVGYSETGLAASVRRRLGCTPASLVPLGMATEGRPRHRPRG